MWTKVITRMALVMAVFGLSSCLSGSGDSTTATTVPAVIPPILSNMTAIQGEPPTSDPTGPAVLDMDTVPALDVAESGATFSLLMLYDDAAFDSLGGAIFWLEGDPYHYILSAAELTGGIAVVSFTISDDYPDGEYFIQIALLDQNGEPGEYVRLLLHVQAVPALEVLKLFPEPGNIIPELRRLEPLNIVGSAVFSKPVESADFTLTIKDINGVEVPGTIYLMPGNRTATLVPAELLNPTSQYSVSVTLISEEATTTNLFYTETPAELGVNSANLVGRVFSFALTGDNVVEPEAAKAVFGLIGSAVPPFLMVVTEADPILGTFSAYGSISSDDVPGVLYQDLRIPVMTFAQGASYKDPYFFMGPTDVPVNITVAGYTIVMTLNDFVQSGNFKTDGTGFDNGAVSLYIDAQEIADLIESFLGTQLPNICGDLADILGLDVCDGNGHIVARAVDVVGTYEPQIEALYDIVPDAPAPASISAATGGVITLGGLVTRNGAALTTGTNVSIVSTVGAVGASPVVTAGDGTFTGTLTVGAGQATAGTPITVTFDAIDISLGAVQPLARTVTITVNP